MATWHRTKRLNGWISKSFHYAEVKQIITKLPQNQHSNFYDSRKFCIHRSSQDIIFGFNSVGTQGEKILQFVIKMCSQQACEQVVTVLLSHQASTSLLSSTWQQLVTCRRYQTCVVNLVATCYVQAISDLLRQLVTSSMKLQSTLLQDAM